jgi:hypothetical protein
VEQLKFSQGIDFLKSRGINLVAIFDVNSLPQALKASGVKIKAGQRLVLLGHGGKRFWNELKREGIEPFHSEVPVDFFSQKIAEQLVSDYWGAASIEWLYPGNAAISLQQLGKLAGWHHDSPMGLGIHPEHGLWFAYRALFLIKAALPPTSQLQSRSPCVSCSLKSCLSVCPAGALNTSEFVDLGCCGEFRIQDNSPCEDRCLAREACPVATQNQYDREQISYHYLHSLAAIRKYIP